MRNLNIKIGLWLLPVLTIVGFALFWAIGGGGQFELEKGSSNMKTPEEITAFLEEAVAEIEKRGKPQYPDPMQAPWEVMPGEPMASMAWRMGSGEEYEADFADWYVSISAQKRADYKLDKPEPEDWRGYYQMLEQRPRPARVKY